MSSPDYLGEFEHIVVLALLRLEERAYGVTVRPVYDHHFKVYAFFASTGIGIGHVFSFLFVGGVVGLAARGREMAATTTLSLIYGAMIGLALLVWMTERPGHEYYLGMLPWNLADLFAIVVGGAIVRMRRSRANTLPSGA